MPAAAASSVSAATRVVSAPVTSASTSGSRVAPATAAASSSAAHAGRQPGQPATDHLADRRGHVGGAAAGREQLAQLAGVERVTAAAFVHQRRPVLPRRRTGDGPHQVGHLAGGQPLQRHQFRDGGQIGEAGGDAGSRLVRPVGADQQQRTGLRLLRHEPQQVHGGLIGPVQVVEDHDHRGVGGGPAQHLPDRVEHADPGRGVGADRGWVGGQLRHDRRQLGPGRRREAGVAGRAAPAAPGSTATTPGPGRRPSRCPTPPCRPRRRPRRRTGSAAPSCRCRPRR